METVSASYCPKNHFFLKNQAPQAVSPRTATAKSQRLEQNPVRSDDKQVLLSSKQQVMKAQQVHFVVDAVAEESSHPSALQDWETLNGFLACIPHRCAEKVYTRDGLPTTLAKMHRQLRKDSLADFIWVLNQPGYQKSYQLHLFSDPPHAALTLTGPQLCQTAGRIFLSLLLDPPKESDGSAYGLMQQFSPGIDPRVFLGALLRLASTAAQSNHGTQPLIQLKSGGKVLEWKEFSQARRGVVQWLKSIEIGAVFGLINWQDMSADIEKRLQSMDWLKHDALKNSKGEFAIPDLRKHPLAQLRSWVWMVGMSLALFHYDGKMQLSSRTTIRALGIERRVQSSTEEKLMKIFHRYMKKTGPNIHMDQTILAFDLTGRGSHICDKGSSRSSPTESPPESDPQPETKVSSQSKKPKMQPLNQKLCEAVRKKLLTKEEQIQLVEIAMGGKPVELERGLLFLTKKLQSAKASAVSG